MPILTLPRVIGLWISLAILAAAVFLLWDWGADAFVRDADGDLVRVEEIDWRVWLGGALLAWSFLGRFVVLMLIPGKPREPKGSRGEAGRAVAPDGSILRLDSYGEAGSPALVLTHGWGLNGTAWSRTTEGLKDRYRLITWDLPGVGRSEKLKGGYSIERFAQALGAVVEATGEDRVVLVGHSIGGMTTETFWRACPEDLKRKVAGVVLVNTTFVDPLKTMWPKGLWSALEKPLVEPLNRLATLVSPLLWLAAWQGYLSGSTHIAMRLTGFGRYASRGEVELTARLATKASPGVQAKGNIAMFNWNGADALPRIDAPVLILAGEKDIVTLPEASDRMAGDIPEARLIRVEGAGHMGFMERAEVYNEAIADFAEEAFRRAGDETDRSSRPSAPPPSATTVH